jgi:putative hydrolase of the HAD superfamily
LDDTLLDFSAVLTRSLELALALIVDRLGEAASVLTPAGLQETRERIAGPAHPGDTMEAIRERAFRTSLAEIGCDDEALLEEVCAVYHAERFRAMPLFDDTLPMLDALQGRFRLAAASNGNSYPDRFGLEGRFDVVLLAQEHGVRKPDPAFFERLCALAGCRPEEVVHVGDSVPADVVGARSAGLHAVWLNRAGLPTPPHLAGVPVIRSLAELPGLLGRR